MDLAEIVQPDVYNSAQVDSDSSPYAQISRVPPVGRED